MGEIAVEELLEKLAEIEHKQWMEWSKNIAKEEQLSEKRLNRWKSLWIPYKDLNEKDKDIDRKYAKKIIELLSGLK